MVAGKLRTAFKLPPATKQGTFDADAFFAEKLADLKVRQAEHAKANAKMWGEPQAKAVVTPEAEVEAKPPPETL